MAQFVVSQRVRDVLPDTKNIRLSPTLNREGFMLLRIRPCHDLPNASWRSIRTRLVELDRWRMFKITRIRRTHDAILKMSPNIP